MSRTEPDAMTSPAEEYHARMRRVLEYIDGHLDGDLRTEVLGDVAGFSKYHFHRQFSELFGITAHRYVNLARMKRASGRLAFHADSTILQIALDTGYESPEAFSRAFKQQAGQTPSEFRERPDWDLWRRFDLPDKFTRSRAMQIEHDDGDVRIVEFPATPVALLEHRGSPHLIGDTIRRFIAWRKRVGLPPGAAATFNILHVDPENTAPEDYRIDLCAATGQTIAPNDESVIVGLIPAGRCAVLRQVGSGDDLQSTVSFLYAEWLPRSGEELRDFPVFAQRVRFYPEVAEHEAVTDLFLPLK